MENFTHRSQAIKLPSEEEIQEFAKEEIQSKADLPFFHKDNVNLDLCRAMWIQGLRFLANRIRTHASLPAQKGKEADGIEELLKWIDEEVLTNKAYDQSPRLRLGANMVKLKIIEIFKSEQK